MPAFVEMSPVWLANRRAAQRAREIAKAAGLAGRVHVEHDEWNGWTGSVPYDMDFKSTPDKLVEFLDSLAREGLIRGPQIVRIYAESDDLSTGAALLPGHGAFEVPYDAIVELLIAHRTGPYDSLVRARITVLTDGRLAVREDAVPEQLLEALKAGTEATREKRGA